MTQRLGTRSRNGFEHERIDQGANTRSYTRDVGMSKNVTDTMTFATSGATVTGSNGDFTAFGVGDPIMVENTNLNNGYFVVTGIDGTNQAFLVLDPPPKNEGPLAGVTVRTP